MRLMKWNLVVVSFLVSGLALGNVSSLSTSSLPCQSSPDMFLTVDAALGSDVNILAYGGYGEAVLFYGSHLKQNFAETGPIGGNETGFIAIAANSACLKGMGVSKVIGELTQLQTDTSDGVVSPKKCKLSVKVGKGHHSLTLTGSNGQYSCQ